MLLPHTSIERPRVQFFVKWLDSLLGDRLNIPKSQTLSSEFPYLNEPTANTPTRARATNQETANFYRFALRVDRAMIDSWEAFRI